MTLTYRLRNLSSGRSPPCDHAAPGDLEVDPRRTAPDARAIRASPQRYPHGDRQPTPALSPPTPIRFRAKPTPTASNSPQWHVFHSRGEGVFRRRGGLQFALRRDGNLLSFTAHGPVRRNVIPLSRDIDAQGWISWLSGRTLARVIPLSSLTDKSHSIPDNHVALLSYSRAWNSSDAER
jgi:hypothetical protein